MLTLGDFVAGVKRATANWADGDHGNRAVPAHPSLPCADTTIAPPEPRRSLAVAPLIGDKRCYGETPARPARDSGGVSQGIVGAMMVVIEHHRRKGFGASHWQVGTCGADDARRLDCGKSLLEVQIRIPGSDRVQSSWGTGILRPYSSYSCGSATSSPLRN